LQLLCNSAISVSETSMHDRSTGGATSKDKIDLAAGRMKLGELGSFIREQRRGARLSLRKLSDLAGISNPYLSQIERGLRKPSAEILQAIARALSISSETLYVRAGILEENRDRDLIAEILKDTKLTEKQKQNLIDTYRNYVELNQPGQGESVVDDLTTE
jgi:transcriptional regulator with XRE-family HTH domain